MFSDSIYIIRINLSKVEDKNPLEVILETDKTVMLIYNIENHFILGITSRRDKVGMARNIATKALKHVSDQLKNVIAWIDS